MKKLLFLAGALCLTPALADVCEYAPEQQMILDIENLQDATSIPNINLNKTYPCGGSLLQLGVIRGNADSFFELLANGADFKKPVSLKGYEIKGAPEQIPFILFASYYAPNALIIDALLDKGVDVKVKDANGHDIFWYLDQNPVLRETEISKKDYSGLLPTAERILRSRQQLR